jgi:hypothetical protein
MSTKFWSATKLIWMKAKGLVLFVYFPGQILAFLGNLFFFSILTFFFEMQAVPTAKGQALADEYGIKFFETVSNLKPYFNFIRSYFFDLCMIHMSTESI